MTVIDIDKGKLCGTQMNRVLWYSLIKYWESIKETQNYSCHIKPSTQTNYITTLSVATLSQLILYKVRLYTTVSYWIVNHFLTLVPFTQLSLGLHMFAKSKSSPNQNLILSWICLIYLQNNDLCKVDKYFFVQSKRKTITIAFKNFSISTLI